MEGGGGGRGALPFGRVLHSTDLLNKQYDCPETTKKYSIQQLKEDLYFQSVYFIHEYSRKVAAPPVSDGRLVKVCHWFVGSSLGRSVGRSVGRSELLDLSAARIETLIEWNTVTNLVDTTKELIL